MTGQSVAPLHLLHRLAEHGFDPLQIFIRGCRGEETGIPLLNMNSLLTHRVVQQTAQPGIAMEGEVKPRSEVMNTAWDTAFNEEIIEPRRQLGSLSIQLKLKLRPSSLQMIEHCTSRSERLRMSHKGPGKEGYANLWNRCIT